MKVITVLMLAMAVPISSDTNLWHVKGRSELPRDSFESVSTYDGRTIWIANGSISGFVSRDAGERWTKVTIAQRPVAIMRIRFFGSQVGWAVGTNAGHPVVLRTLDGGSTWNLAHRVTEVRSGVFLDVDFSGSTGVAVGGGDRNDGPGAIAYVTRDGGITWRATFLSVASHQPLRRVLMHTQAEILAVGGPDIVASSDGGATWRRVHRDAGPADLNGLARMNRGRMIAAGGPGVLLVSDIPWQEWHHIRLPEAARDVYLWAVTSTRGKTWICGDKGSVLSSTNGGKWTSEETGQRVFIRDIVAVGSRVFAVGDAGVFLYMHDKSR